MPSKTAPKCPVHTTKPMRVAYRQPIWQPMVVFGADLSGYIAVHYVHWAPGRNRCKRETVVLEKVTAR